MSVFASVTNVEKNKLDELHQGSLFHTIEYELSGIVNKISNIDNLDEKEIKDIIIKQHSMILDYDLFLMSDETRAQAQTLFTNKKFLECFISVIRLLELSHQEKICVNKLAYDYYILPEKDIEISNLLYQLTTEVNGREVVVLSGILGLSGARILSMIRNSTFKEEKAVHRVNTYIIKYGSELSVQNIVNIYCFLFERFSILFTSTMMEAKPSNLNNIENKNFDNISVAILELLNSLNSTDIRRVLLDYAYTIKMVKINTVLRFPLKAMKRYSRIISILKEVELTENIIIP